MGYLREIHFTIARMIEATKRKDEKDNLISELQNSLEIIKRKIKL